MPPEWVELWTQCCAQLADAMSKLPPGRSLLAYLYSRIGADAGTCVRGLHNAGVCWGTYLDFMTRHCNAHANNLMLVPPSAIPSDAPGSKRLVCICVMSIFKQSLSRKLQISMLDLDMAFDASSFVDGFPPGKASGNVSERAMEHERTQRISVNQMFGPMLLQVGMDQARFDNLLFHEYLTLMDTLSGGWNTTGECFGCFRTCGTCRAFGRRAKVIV
jgi:hypothetical protein